MFEIYYCSTQSPSTRTALGQRECTGSCPAQAAIVFTVLDTRHLQLCSSVPRKATFSGVEHSLSTFTGQHGIHALLWFWHKAKTVQIEGLMFWTSLVLVSVSDFVCSGPVLSNFCLLPSSVMSQRDDTYPILLLWLWERFFKMYNKVIKC